MRRSALRPLLAALASLVALSLSSGPAWADHHGKVKAEVMKPTASAAVSGAKVEKVQANATAVAPGSLNQGDKVMLKVKTPPPPPPPIIPADQLNKGNIAKQVQPR
jgi:hypothetical protein